MQSTTPAVAASIVSRKRAHKIARASEILEAIASELTTAAYNAEPSGGEAELSARQLSRVAGQADMASGVLRDLLIGMQVYLSSAEAEAALAAKYERAGSDA